MSAANPETLDDALGRLRRLCGLMQRALDDLDGDPTDANAEHVRSLGTLFPWEVRHVHALAEREREAA